MSEQIQEPLADVLAEMRKDKGFPVPFAPDWSRAVLTTDLVEYADRIEAAWKREREEAEADALAVGGIVEAKRKPSGNIAAMRELKACKEAVLDFCDVFTLVYPPNDGDCPAVLAGAFELLKDAMGIETVETGKGAR